MPRKKTLRPYRVTMDLIVAADTLHAARMEAWNGLSHWFFATEPDRPKSRLMDWDVVAVARFPQGSRRPKGGTKANPDAAGEDDA